MNKKVLYIFIAFALASLGMAPYSNAASHPAEAAQPLRSAAIAYYVDNTNLTTCSDTLNDGLSPAKPFCTIGKAAGLAVAGDTVHVVAGTYLETVNPDNNGTSGSPITFSAGAGVTVKGNGTSTGSGFHLAGAHYITIDGFNVIDTVDHGIYVLGSSNIIITNNTVSSAGTASSGLDRAGIYFSGVTASTISGNTTHENSSHGITVQGSSSAITVSNNKSYGNAYVVGRIANGIIVQSSTNVTVIHNIVYNNEDSGIGIYTGSNNASVIGNLSYGNSDHGIDVNGSKTAIITGNTLQGNATSGINLEGNSPTDNSSGGKVQNNLSVSNGINPPAGHAPGNIRVDDNSITGTTVNYNLVYQSGTLVEYTWGSTDYTTLSAFQAASGQESAGLQADPLFVAPAAPVTQPVSGGGHPPIATGNYHLQAASPAIDSANSGAPSEPLLDIEGKARVDYLGTPNTGVGPRAYDDRGAYEFQLLIPQTITFTSTAPASAVVGGPTYTPTATGGASGNPVVITIDATASSVCTISGLGVVSFIGVGTCVIDANQAGGNGYLAAPQVQQSFPVGKGSQVITFTSTAPASAGVGGPTYTPTATGGASGNPVVITIDATSSSVCSISGLGVVSFTAVGTCVIDANQAGNANYNAAPQVQQSFTVGKGSQVITFTSTAPTNAVVAGPTYTPTATGGASGNPVVFTIDASASTVCAISGLGVVSFNAVGTCVINANQAGNANYNAAPQVQQSFPVGKGSQVITFTSTAPAHAVMGGANYTPTATGGASGNPVVFTIDASASTVCSISGLGVVSFIGAGTCVINANQAGNANYNAASQVQQSFSVAPILRVYLPIVTR